MSLTLQGHIWRTGFEKNELEGVVFEDVPEALEKWHSLGIKVIFLFPPFILRRLSILSCNTKTTFWCRPIRFILDYSSKHFISGSMRGSAKFQKVACHSCVYDMNVKEEEHYRLKW